MALASPAHESARVLQPHLRGGVPVTLAPVVRAVLESTLTTVWVDREPDAAHAFLDEDRRQRGALARALAGFAASQAGEPWSPRRRMLWVGVLVGFLIGLTVFAVVGLLIWSSFRRRGSAVDPST